MKPYNIKLLLVPLLILSLFGMTASAIDYSITATLETVQVTGNVNAWTTPVSFSLNKTESKTMYGMTVNYADIGNSNTLALFRITGGTSTDAALAKNQVACIKGNCQMTNGTPTTIGDTRLTLTDIVQQSTVSTTLNSTGVTSDNVVTVYLSCSTGEKLNLNRNGANTYDPTMCNTKTGWSNSADKELPLYIRRNFNIPTTISIVTPGSYNEKDLIENGNTRPYILTSNAKYVINVKTTRTDVWGGSIEETGVYTLTVTGLSSTGTITTSQVKIHAPYDVSTSKPKPINMGETVTFETIPGAEVSKTAENTYTFEFRAAGNYKIPFTRTDGTKDYIEFSVTSEAPPASKETVKTNQKQPVDGETDYMRFGLFGLFGLGLISLVYFGMKRKSNQPTLHINPSKNN